MSARPALLAADQITDAELVALCRTGDRMAFAQIVARYQSLICALAYSGIGDLAQSEDLAQETFVTAWRYLADLREPAKLRAWLCEIVRRRVHHLRRQEAGEPTHAADSLTSAHTLAAPEPSPAALAIQRDEETILWREMEQIPELYREPLILFYRQNQSIERVAAALDLSEDAVKQRLSRGRKLLQEQVLAFVEGTLARTNPGPAFTAQVMSALPIAAGSAALKTATAATATAAAKVATTAKATGILGGFGMLVWPVIVLLAGLGTIIEDSMRPKRGEEREFMKMKALVMVLSLILSAPLVLAMLWAGETLGPFGRIMSVGVVLVATLTVVKGGRKHTSWTINAFLAMGTKQTASMVVFVALMFILDDYQIETLVLLVVTLLGLVIAKLAKLGDPDHWKFVVRAAGWVAFLQLTTSALHWSDHSTLFIGTLAATGFGFMIMYLVISPETPTPPDATG